MAPNSHLRELEAKSIRIFRETAAGFDKPILLYSIGKDSSVLIHLARKAFFPAAIPFPVMHVDTTWKFREMIEFRERKAREFGLRLLIHTNPAGVRDKHNPVHTRFGALYRHHEN